MKININTSKWWIEYCKRPGCRYSHPLQAYPEIADPANHETDSWNTFAAWVKINPFDGEIDHSPRTLADYILDQKSIIEEHDALVKTKAGERRAYLRDQAANLAEKPSERHVPVRGEPGFTPGEFGMNGDDWHQLDMLARLPRR